MSEMLLDRLLKDRSNALRPAVVLQGISTAEQLRLVKEIETICMVVRGMFVEMQMDGIDTRSKAGVMLLRLRSELDTLEAVNCRLLHDRDGVIIEGSYERE